MVSPKEVPTLQKMEIADLIDAAIRLYRHNFLPLLQIVAVVYGPLMVIQIIAQYLFFNQLMATGGEEIPWPARVGLGPVVLIVVAAWVVLFPISEGALAVGVSEIYLGQHITLASVYRRVLPLWWKLLLTMVAVSAVMSVGMLFCLVPGIVFWIWFLTATPIVAIERLWGVGAMGRSYNLVTGHGWRVFATWLLLSLMVGVVSYAVALPANLVLMLTLMETHPALAQTLIQAISTVLQIVLRPVAMIGIVLIYYDLRIRKEGFDLVMMAQELYQQAPQRQPAPAAPPLFSAGVALPPRPREDTDDAANLPPPPPQAGIDNDQAG